MKRILFLGFMLCMNVAIASNIEVNITSSSSFPGWTPGSPLPACAGTNTIRIAIKNISGTATGNFTVVVKSNQGLLFNLISTDCTSAIFINDSIKVNSSNLAPGDSCITFFSVSIPCSVNDALFLTPSLIPGSTVTLTNPGAQSLSYQLPEMVIDPFRDSQGNTIPPNSVQLLILTPETFREFEIKATDGIITDFVFNYTPEHEILWDRFEVQAYIGVAPVGSPVTYNTGNPVPPFTTTVINSFFGRPYMINGDRLVFREFFMIDSCTSVSQDGTEYNVTLNCPSQSNLCDNIDASRNIEVIQAGGYPKVNFLGLSTPFQICGDSSTDITYSISNNNATPAGSPGSNINSLNVIRFPIDTSWFSYQFIELLSDSNESVTAIPPGFLTLLNGDVILDFNVLTSPLFNNNSPLVDTFLKDNIFNELITGRHFKIIFRNCQFQCTGNAGTHDLFESCKGGSSNYMFFSQSYYDGNVSYRRMCGDSTGYNILETTQFAYRYATETLLESDETDLETGETATLDYQFSILQNPFNTGGVIGCDSVVYFPVIEVSPRYILDSVRYYQDAALSSFEMLSPLFTHVNAAGDSVYRLEHDSMSTNFTGRIEAFVRLFHCPINTGGFDTIRIKHYAVCDSCYDCAFNMKCNEIAIYRHCQGECSGPAANTRAFSFNRVSMGYTDSTMTTLVSDTLTGIKLNRTYPCDSIYVTSTGTITPAGYTVDSIYFRIQYNSPSNFQYYQFISGYFEIYDSTTQVTTNYPLTTADLVGNWTNNCSTCELKFNLPSSVPIQTLLINKASVTLHAWLQVRNNIPDALNNNFNMPQIRGEYISVEAVNHNIHASCDSWGDNMLVMNVRTVWEQRTNNPDIVSVLKEENWATESLNYPFYHSVCERRFVVTTRVIGGYNLFDDFPVEFRPITLWPDATAGDTLRMDLPLNLSYGIAKFNARVYHNTWHTVDAAVVQDSVLLIWGINNQGWPVIEHDGTHPIEFRLTGSLFNDCPPEYYLGDSIARPDSAYIRFPYTSRAYTATVCQDKDTSEYMSTYYTINYSMDMYSLLDTFQVYSTTDTLNNIVLNFHDSTGYWGPYITNVWVYPLPNTNCTVTDIFRNTTPLATNPGGFYTAGNLQQNTPGAISVGIQINDCIPDSAFTLQLLYGYSCVGYPSHIDSVDVCRMDTLTLLIVPRQSGLSLAVVNPGSSGVSSCDTITFVATLTSNNLADAENPSLVVTAPSLTLVSASGVTNSTSYPGGSIVSQQWGDSVLLDINTSIYNGDGMPGSGHTATITMHFVPDCLANSGNYSLNFNAAATNICNGQIVIVNDSINLPAIITNTLAPLQGVLSTTATHSNCDSLLSLDVNLTGLQYNGQADINGIITLPSGFSLNSSSVSTSGNNPVSWFQLVGGSSANAGFTFNVPQGYCGWVNYSVGVLLNDSLMCGGLLCSDSIQLWRTDSVYVCCSVCDLDVVPVVTHSTCNTSPNGSIILNVSGGTLPYVFNWSHGPTTQAVYNLAPGNYSVVVTDSLGCADTLTVTINNLDFTNFYISPQDTTICAGTSITLTANGCANCAYYWVPGGATTQSIIVSPGSTTVYTVYATTPSGCRYRDSRQVTVVNCGDELLCKYVLNNDHPDIGKDIELTSDDGFVVVGTMLRSSGEKDAYVVKYDQGMNFQFARRIGQAATQLEWRNEQANAVIQHDNYYYFTGTVEITDRDTDVYVVKLDGAGNVVWAYRYGRARNEGGTGIHMVPSDNGEALIVTGYSNHERDGNAFQFMAMKIDPNNGFLYGTHVYDIEKTYYSRSNASVFLRDRSAIVMAGEFSEAEDMSQKHILCLKIDLNLNLLQTNKVENDYAEEVANNIIEIDEHLFVTGRTSATHSLHNIYLLKLNTGNLTVVDNRIFGNAATNEVGYGITVSEDRDVVITGTTAIPEQGAHPDALVLKVSSQDLSLQWVRRITAEYNQTLYSITPRAANGYATTGIWGVSDTDEEIFVSLIDSDGKGCCYIETNLKNKKVVKEWSPKHATRKPVFHTISDKDNKPYYDEKPICGDEHPNYRLIKAETLPVLKEVSVYPNPNTGAFTLAFNEVHQDITLNLFDYSGRKVFNRSINANSSKQLEVKSRQAPGVYLLQVITKEKTWTLKLIVQQ